MRVGPHFRPFLSLTQNILAVPLVNPLLRREDEPPTNSCLAEGSRVRPFATCLLPQQGEVLHGHEVGRVLVEFAPFFAKNAKLEICELQLTCLAGRVWRKGYLLDPTWSSNSKLIISAGEFLGVFAIVPSKRVAVLTKISPIARLRWCSPPEFPPELVRFRDIFMLKLHVTATRVLGQCFFLF